MRPSKRTTRGRMASAPAEDSNANEKVENAVSGESPCSLHSLSKKDILSVRRALLAWYDTNQRRLPWRDLAKSTTMDSNQKGYSIWVSEIMLQQTQVATVIDYYKKWLAKWPTVDDLAKATLEEVNQVWAGLGYYSRGKSLHEGAQYICSTLGGQLPTDHYTLMKEVKGIGRYTAAAVASIAFGQVVGLVDGNVSRVLSRLRAVGADITKNRTIHLLWKLADELVDVKRPGDFNQALMELGATICTPRKPECSACPLRTHCHAYKMCNTSATSQEEKEEEVPDIESANCSFCLTNIADVQDQGVCIYPRKAVKKPPRKENHVVVVLEDTSNLPSRFLMVRRPSKGLLANLWEFPNFSGPGNSTAKLTEKLMLSSLKDHLNLSSVDVADHTFSGEVVHIFSHIHSTYHVYKIRAESKNVDVGKSYPEYQWLTLEEISSTAVPTCMNKVLKCAQKQGSIDATVKAYVQPRKKPKVNKTACKTSMTQQTLM